MSLTDRWAGLIKNYASCPVQSVTDWYGYPQIVNDVSYAMALQLHVLAWTSGTNIFS